MRKSRAIRPFFRLTEINGNRVFEEVSNETCVFPIVPVREFKILNCEIGKPESGSSPDTCVALYRAPVPNRIRHRPTFTSTPRVQISSEAHILHRLQRCQTGANFSTAAVGFLLRLPAQALPMWPSGSVDNPKKITHARTVVTHTHTYTHTHTLFSHDECARPALQLQVLPRQDRWLVNNASALSVADCTHRRLGF